MRMQSCGQTSGLTCPAYGTAAGPQPDGVTPLSDHVRVVCACCSQGESIYRCLLPQQGGLIQFTGGAVLIRGWGRNGAKKRDWMWGGGEAIIIPLPCHQHLFVLCGVHLYCRVLAVSKQCTRFFSSIYAWNSRQCAYIYGCEKLFCSTRLSCRTNT